MTAHFFKKIYQCCKYFREKKLSRNGSLKVLNHSMSGEFGADNCSKFIDILGLRSIFPLFMQTPKKNKKRTLSVEEHEGKRNLLRITRMRIVSSF